MTFHGEARLFRREADGNFSLKTTVFVSGASSWMQAKVLSWWGSRLGGSAAITASSTPPRRGVSAAAAGRGVATTKEPVSRARIMAEKKAIGTSYGTVESVARTGRSRPR